MILSFSCVRLTAEARALPVGAINHFLVTQFLCNIPFPQLKIRLKCAVYQPGHQDRKNKKSEKQFIPIHSHVLNIFNN
jgi:hypothetical protein